MPIEPTPTSISLPNGSNVAPPRGGRGLGELTIRNGTPRDAVAKLVLVGQAGTRAPDGQVLRFVYIRANSDVTIREIDAGAYHLRFGTGSDWDVIARKFRRDTSYSEFVDAFDYRETPTATGTQYSVYEVTLNPVVGGTAHTSGIDEARFGQD